MSHSTPDTSPRIAIVTLSIAADERNNRWMAAGKLSKREYAQRLGADFIDITKPRLGGSVASEKYQIGEILTMYDRVVYLDADLFIRPDAPNLFDVVPKDHFGIFDESTYLDPSPPKDGVPARKKRTALVQWLLDGWPNCGCPFYANNGVFVCSKEHRWLFDHKGLNRKLNTYEQTHMVYRIWEALQQQPPKINVYWLSMAWNWMPRTWVGNTVSPANGWVSEPMPNPCWVYHFPCHKPEERAAALEGLNMRFGLCTAK